MSGLNRANWLLLAAQALKQRSENHARMALRETRQGSFYWARRSERAGLASVRLVAASRRQMRALIEGVAA